MGTGRKTFVSKHSLFEKAWKGIMLFFCLQQCSNFSKIQIVHRALNEKDNIKNVEMQDI